MPVTKYTRGRTSAPAKNSGNKKPDTFMCHRCKKVMNKTQLARECSVVKSPLWEGNGYRLPVCNDCLNVLYDFYYRSLGDPYAAYRRICMKFDIYYNDAIVDGALKESASTDRIKPYISQLNYARNSGKTYDNTIEEEHNKYIYGDFVFQYEDEDGNLINAKEELEKLKKANAQLLANENQDQPDPELECRFGLGFTSQEYVFMQHYYENQIAEIPEGCREVLDETLKDMCRFKSLQSRSFRTNSLAEIEKYSSLFQKSLKYKDDMIAKYKKTESENTDVIVMSSLTEMIENFNPAEVYKKKGVFDDVDGIKDYLERFVYRPLKNFFTGSREMDKEFNVNDERGERNG